MCRRMPRAAIAVPVGVLGFLLYIGAVVALADHVLGLHWAAQLAFFLVAGVAWAFPARSLVLWAGGRR
jgi:hypothetical protein